MAFIQVEGAVKSDAFPKKASTAIPSNNALAFDASGFITVATAASASIAGVSRRTVVSTDSDYAATTKLPVTLAHGEAIFEADVVTGTATAALVGTRCDLADATGVDVTGTTHNVVTIVGFISASKVLVKFNASYIGRDGA